MSTELNSVTSRAMEMDERHAVFQTAETEETKTVENETDIQKISPSSNGDVPPTRDEYVHEPPVTPIGLYRLEQGENGKPKIVFDDPEKTNGIPKTEGGHMSMDAANAKDGQKPGDAENATDGSQPKNSPKSENASKSEDASKSEETCIGNTDKVDREIKHLKEEKKRLEQQIRAASGDEGKIEKLKQKLEQVEQELARKDTETYRRQHTTFSS